MRKRRVFDLDLPEEDSTPPEAPGEEARRRGPMAAAITETGAALQDRAATMEAIRAENDALALAHVAARAAGLVAERVDLGLIDTTKLIRDRRARPDDDGALAEMTESLRDVGLSNPIRLEEAGQGRYELIQGFRRLCAYRALLDETGDTEAWGSIPALVSPPGTEIETLYRRMVDENLVRQDISFYEMARLAQRYADGAGEDTDPGKAVALLFRSAGYQKRSYIRGFLPLVAHLDGVLRFPEQIPRALGLKLAARIAEPGVVGAIRADLADNRTAEDELAVLRMHAEPAARRSPGPKPAPSATASVLSVDHATRGAVRCTVGKGRLELALDLTDVSRERLEAALRAFLDRIA